MRDENGGGKIIHGCTAIHQDQVQVILLPYFDCESTEGSDKTVDEQAHLSLP